MADWRRGSPQGSPTPSLEGGPLGEAVSFRAGNPGFRDILPLAEGGREHENQLLRNPYCGEEAGSRGQGAHGRPHCPPGLHRQNRPTGRRQVRRPGAEGPSQEPQTEGRYPRAFKPVPRSLTKAKRAPGRKQALEEGQGGGNGPVSCAPRTMKQLLPQSPVEAQSRCAERARARRGEGVRSPFLWCLQTWGPSVGPVGILRPL